MRTAASWLGALLLAAALLRGTALDFGLDFADPDLAVLSHQNDEQAMAQAVRERLLRGHLHPGVFLHWGSLAFYLFGAADAVVLAARSAIGPDTFHGLVAGWDVNPSEQLLVHRVVALACGLLTLLLTWSLARRHLGRSAALAAGCILASCYLHVRESHFGTLETLQGLLLLMTADRSLRFLSDPRPRQLAIAFTTAGLAAAAKYSGIVAVALPVVAWIWTRRTRGRAAPGWPGLLAAALLAPLAFLAVSPHLSFAAADLLEILRRQSEVVGFRAEALPKVLAYHARETFWIGFGEPGCVLALAGLVLLAAQRATRPLALLPLASFALLVTTSTTAVRYGAPLVPFLAVWAGHAVAAAGRRWGGAARLLLLVAALAPGLVRSVAFDRLLLSEDTRSEVARFLRGHGAAADDVLAFGDYGLIRVPHWDFLRMVYGNRTWTAADALALRPRFLVVERSDPRLLQHGFDPFWRGAGAEYRLVLDLESRRDGRSPELPDWSTGSPNFLVPWARPWSMTRTGPSLAVYERIVPAK